MHIVGDEDDGDSVCSRLMDESKDDLSLLNAQCGSRLVQNQNPATKIDGTRNRQSLLLSTRHDAYQLVTVADSTDAHSRDLVDHNRPCLFMVNPFERSPAFRRLKAEKEIARHAHEGNDADVLVHCRNAEVLCFSR